MFYSTKKTCKQIYWFFSKTNNQEEKDIFYDIHKTWEYVFAGSSKEPPLYSTLHFTELNLDLKILTDFLEPKTWVENT